MKERLVLGLISIIGLVIMLIGGTMQSSFISGILFLLGMFIFGIFFQEAVTTRITIQQALEENQKFLK